MPAINTSLVFGDPRNPWYNMPVCKDSPRPQAGATDGVWSFPKRPGTRSCVVYHSDGFKTRSPGQRWHRVTEEKRIALYVDWLIEVVLSAEGLRDTEAEGRGETEIWNERDREMEICIGRDIERGVRRQIGREA